MKRTIFAGCLAAAVALVTTVASAAPLYSNGFEADTTDWSAQVTRVASGTNSVPSSSGAFHATTTAGGFTRWGGYNYGAGATPTAFQPYQTSVDIYLNIDGGWNNDTRFDFTSAINGSAGAHLRDFAFNGGFYDDATGPGAGMDRFVFSASNSTGRANSFPKNPGRDPFAISTTGWYTFQHTFYDNSGVLAVDLDIFDSSSSLIHGWTLGTADLIATVGGNRYGWFANSEFSSLAIDNALLEITSAAVVPEPATLMLVGLSLLGLAATRRRAGRTGY